MKYDVIIIGAGAAGLFVAGMIGFLNKNISVLVLERGPKAGKKLAITGKGRCNVTNDCDNRTFLENVRTNSKFLYSAINNFSSADCMSFFENNGVKLKTERGNRVFPVSDNANEIVNCLINFAKKHAEIKFNEKVMDVVTENNEIVGVKTMTDSYTCKNVVVATGGKSYKVTGSDGMFYDVVKKIGHEIIEPKPSLVPIVIKEDICKNLQGLSLKNVEVTLKLGDKIIYKEMGEMLFTHFGVSGPLILSASSHIKGDISNYSLEIDFKPALDEKKLDMRILRDFNEFINKNFINSLSKLLPTKLIPIVVKLSGIDGQIKVNEITKQQRTSLVCLLKHFKLTPIDFLSIDTAIITSGGVNTKQINPKTMESKLISGLYFCGEVIDCDAYTGGFNLQIAFSTANLVAKSLSCNL